MRNLVRCKHPDRLVLAILDLLLEPDDKDYYQPKPAIPLQIFENEMFAKTPLF